ncbi:MAG: O-antigen translocase [Bacteroidia bacterium]|nr:O-antigen translocase [Bacteroidia bacterium]MBT8269494.1 O-antigen translocase [Bacteroidia bacterium]NNF83063.1 O-antigen translocase [Flavobacteriaceae bacterium]NNK70703.1 O-antigen translocase [Flavobacteriaceae bacterium]NNL81132.1 O-antigen translocase [Flavobacteriaceae bacterium]
MKKLINYINKKVLVSAVKLHSATVITKIAAGFLTTKFIAYYIGPEGLALIGNLRSFLSSIQSFGTVGIYNGLVKYIKKYKSDVIGLGKTISTGYYMGFLATAFIAMMSYFNAELINDYLFSDQYDFVYVIKIMALALPFYSLNLFSYSIMNGFEKYKFLMIINIIGQIMSLAVSLLLIWQNNIDGALIAVVIAPSLMFLITLVGIVGRPNFLSSIKVSLIDYKIVKKFLPFSIMALVSGIIFPLVIIAIRNYIISAEGLRGAGFWEAMNRISTYYLLFVNSIMALYFLPRFSEIDSKKEFRSEVFDFYKTIIPILGLGLFVIYLLRDYVIAIFLTSEFKAVEDLFLWQLLGDFVKVLSVVIAYQFIAKKMFWHFIITEAFLLIITYFTSVYLIDIYGVKGANMGHLVSYLLYFLLVILILASSLFGIIPEDEVDKSTD